MLEVSAQVGLVGEVEAIGNLLYGEGGGVKGDFQFQNHIIVNPLLGRAAHGLPDGLAEVAGGDAEFVGIEIYGALLAEVLYHQGYEAVLQSPPHPVGHGLLIQPFRLVADFIEQHAAAVDDEFAAVEVFGIGRFLLQ